jgi:hypothetical protein
MSFAPERLPEDLSVAEAYYVLDGREGEVAHFRSTIHAQGAWNPGEQHMAPATGILVHELERFQRREGMRMVRVSLDILGLIPGGAFSVTTRMLRPGRTIELVEATLEAHGRTSIVARAWRLLTSDTSEVAHVQEVGMLGPEECVPRGLSTRWPGGYIASLTGVGDPASGGGSGAAWLSNDLEMVAGEETSPLARLLGMVDTANGVAPRLDPREWAFPNVDLQIHVFRAPRGRRLGLQVVQSVGADGVGLTSSVLHDEAGPFGRAEQILTVRSQRPPA